MHPLTGVTRFSFGIPELHGIPLVVVSSGSIIGVIELLGMNGIGECRGRIECSGRWLRLLSKALLLRASIMGSS